MGYEQGPNAGAGAFVNASGAALGDVGGIVPAEGRVLPLGTLSPVGGFQRANLAQYLWNNRVWNVLDYTPYPGPGVDNTAGIQAAINACAAAGGGIVRLPATGSTLGGAHYRITTLSVPAGVSLIGDNWRTTLLVQSLFSGDALTVTAAGDFQVLAGFSVYGDRANQVTVNNGIRVNVTGVPPFTDSFTTLRDVYVFECRGNGIQIGGAGGRAMHVLHCLVRRSALSGMVVQATDSVIEACFSGANDADGFVCGANQVKYIGCKAYGNVNGFSDPNGAGTFVGCEAQENSNNGFSITGSANVRPSTYGQCVADSNGNIGFAVATANAAGTILDGCAVTNTTGLAFSHVAGINLDDAAAPVIVLGCNVQAGSTVRIGGTLGLHLIAATQRVTDGPINTVPSGSGYQVAGVRVVSTRGAAVSTVAGTAGATYTATEQGIINALVTAVNALISRLGSASGHGLIT